MREVHIGRKGLTPHKQSIILFYIFFNRTEEIFIRVVFLKLRLVKKALICIIYFKIIRKNIEPTETINCGRTVLNVNKFKTNMS